MPKHKHDPKVLAAVGARLQVIREQRGLTQQELAEAVGIGTTVLSRYETGSRGPSLSTMALAADALGVEFADLLAIDRPVPEPDRDPRVHEAVRVLSDLADADLDLAVGIIDQFRSRSSRSRTRGRP